MSPNESRAASPYDRVIVFGDSLSDTGTYSPVARGVGGGKFPTNPGKLWIEIVAEKLGRDVDPNRFEGFRFPLVEMGGTNYAQGGARISTLPPSSGSTPSATSRSLKEQFNLFVGERAHFDVGNLVFAQGGANDLFVILQKYRSGSITPA